MTIANPQDFATALLQALNDPVTADNIADIEDWEAAEGGNWGNSAAYNPLNTTLSAPGDTSVNSVGVKAYTSWSEGLGATVSTLQEQGGSEYPNILAALQAGNVPPTQFGNIGDLNTWGTGTGKAAFGDNGTGGASLNTGSTAGAGAAPTISTTSIGKILTELDTALNPQSNAGILGEVPILGSLLTGTENVVYTVVMRGIFALVFAGIGTAGLVLLIRKPAETIAGPVLGKNPITGAILSSRRSSQSQARLSLQQSREARLAEQAPAREANRQVALLAGEAKSQRAFATTQAREARLAETEPTRLLQRDQELAIRQAKEERLSRES